MFRLTVAAICASYLLPLTLYFLRHMTFTVEWRTDPSTNQTMAYMATTTWLPVDSRLVTNVSHYFRVVVKPVFVVIMIVCCVITVLHLRRASRARGAMGG
ncbi:hypothetical protein ACOMHN_058648 [Nucella lapillus]